MNAKVK